MDRILGVKGQRRAPPEKFTCDALHTELSRSFFNEIATGKFTDTHLSVFTCSGAWIEKCNTHLTGGMKRIIHFPAMNDSNETIKKVLSKVEYDPNSHQFLLNGKDIKRKRAHGFWTVRISIAGVKHEAYCHLIIYYINTGRVPEKQIRFHDENKDNLDFSNLYVSGDKAKQRRKKDALTEKIFIAKKDSKRVCEILKEAGILYSKIGPSYIKKKLGEESPVETSPEGLGVPCWFSDSMIIVTFANPAKNDL